MEQYGDYTGFEAFYNEMRIIDYIDIGNANLATLLFGIVELKIYLNKMFPQYSFIIIGLINKGQVNLRFHMLGQNEIGRISDVLICSMKQFLLVQSVVLFK